MQANPNEMSAARTLLECPPTTGLQPLDVPRAQLFDDTDALTGLLEIAEMGMNYGAAEKLTRNAKARPEHDGDRLPCERRKRRICCRAIVNGKRCNYPLNRGDSMEMRLCPTHWHLYRKERPIYMAEEE